jgi:hypothetical protein
MHRLHFVASSQLVVSSPPDNHAGWVPFWNSGQDLEKGPYIVPVVVFVIPVAGRAEKDVILTGAHMIEHSQDLRFLHGGKSTVVDRWPWCLFGLFLNGERQVS